jgi:YVTN family beta-propeller protein
MTAPGQLRGSAIALTPDDSHLVVVNRDVGTVTVMSVAVDVGGEPVMTEVAELPVGNEPWQVVVDACGANAYVVLRQDQKVVAIHGIDTATPTVGASAATGSEPTSLSLTPNNTLLYVSNWVDGSLTVVDPQTMTVTSTIDLNATLAATGLLGPDVMAAPRPALAHPRGIAVTNNGDTSDTDETVYVTEWYALRTEPESLTPAPTPTSPPVSDVNWEGLLYSVPVATGEPSTIMLPPVQDTGFLDANGNQTGCFPNQVASVTLDGNGFAYVTSTCASPAGPTGVFQKGACSVDSECTAAIGSSANGAPGSCVNGACILECTMDSTCGVGSNMGACGPNGACAPLLSNAKTTTHPAVSVVTLSSGAAATTLLDTLFTTPADIAPVGGATMGVASTRMPLLPVDIDFKGTGFAYVASQGADALFRLTISNGTFTEVGSSTDTFIDVRTAADSSIHLPIGVAVSQNAAFAYVANDAGRNVEAIDLNHQAVAQETGSDFRVTQSTAAPTGAALSVLDGKRAFTTGLGRWSLNGAAWGSCAACHYDGLSDGVTWYFARGPRQSVSLDGTFNKADPTDQRILNWTGIFDEVADFEGNVRGISGGVGAIVATVSSPPVASDRVNLFNFTPNQQGLEGSSTDIANPNSTTTGHSVLTSVNWADITNYVAQIRSPRAVSANAPNAFSPAQIAAGRTLFGSSQGNCVACHSGPKWTISEVFYTPGDVPNDAYPGTGASSLSETSWDANLNGFPPTLFPSTVANAETDMRSGLPPTFEQLQCGLRPVGTIVANAAGGVPTGVSPAAVGVVEVRQDMKTGAQGAGNVNASDFTQGYNPPSLLGLQVGAPYFHAGNARSLEEAFTTTFQGHFQTAVAEVFSPSAAETEELIAYLLSIDGSTAPLSIPPVGASGGSICHYP